MTSTEVLLRVDRLVKHFPIRRGVLIQRQVGAVHAVDDISFNVYRGETLAWSENPAAVNPLPAGQSCSSTGQPPVLSISKTGI